jgi:hypothetical protein
MSRAKSRTTRDPSGCKTMSVPEAGKLYYDLGRNGSYEAAKRGLIPTIQVLGKKRVPIVLMERRLARISHGGSAAVPVWGG